MARGVWRMSGYRVQELLGSGSSGEVWRGRVDSTGAAVALKRLWLSDPAQRKAALSEAAMLSALDHPHLMKLHEVRHLDDDAIVLVLDLASGGSLATLLARRGRLTLGEVITTIAPIAAALAYAHHAGVVHGDVSAANILFTDIGLPLLADLGVARLLGDVAPVRTTPIYVDPAVAAGALPGPASDVFMLGAVAMHALTGSPPWPGTAASAVLEEAANGAQPDFAARLAAAGVPHAAVEIIARALNVEPALRGTAADFALELRHSGEPVAVELSAGRARVTPTLHSVVGSTDNPLGSWPLDPLPGAGSPGAASGAYMSGVPVVEFTGEQPLTVGVRAPSRSTASTGRHQIRSRLRIAPGLLACVVLLAGALAASIWWWPFNGGGLRHQTHVAEAAGRPGSRSSSSPGTAGVTLPPSPQVSRSRSSPQTSGLPPSRSPSSSRPSSSRSPSSSRPSSSHSPAPLSFGPSPPSRLRADWLNVAQAGAVLADLDAFRAAAFAARDPTLLVSVYASRVLLARDTAALTSIVPPGCGLRGVRTQFSGLVITARGVGRVDLRVRARLAPSTLICGGTTSGRAAGAPANVVQLELVRQGSTYRIAAQRRR